MIPSAVLPNLYKLADDNYKRDGHQFYVDGTPVAGDVWNGSAWRTILVGGLNAGGKGYYALDVTNPGATPTPLWEFKQVNGSCPLPAPAAMPSGIYVRLQPGPHVRQADHHQAGRQLGRHRHLGLQQRQRRLRRRPGLSLRAGRPHRRAEAEDHDRSRERASATPRSPSGLAQINNYVDNVDIDNTTLRAYGGDVLGNIWRFDFVAGTATMLGTAKDASNNVQPITIRPELAELDGKPFVMVGTGKYLGGTDVDRRAKAVGVRHRGSADRQQPDLRRPAARTRSGRWRSATSAAAAGAVRKHHLHGLGRRLRPPRAGCSTFAEAGERVNVEMKLVARRLCLHEQRSRGCPVQRRRPQLVQPDRLPHRCADPRCGRELEVPVRFAQRRLQRAGTGFADPRRQPERITASSGRPKATSIRRT